MGRFAELAERHWRTHLPAAYVEIADRPVFFAELETEAERQVFELEDALAGPDLQGEWGWITFSGSTPLSVVAGL